MKKKYRTILCFAINGLLAILMLPFALINLLAELSEIPVNLLCRIGEKVKTKLRVYDVDPD